MALTKYSDQGYPLTTAQLDANWTYFNNSKIVSVKDYGAVGDGVTDDTSAIQAAIDANQTAWIDFGEYADNYLCSSAITLVNSSGKNFQGSLIGRNARITFSHSTATSTSDSAMAHGFEVFPVTNGVGGDITGWRGGLIQGLIITSPANGAGIFLSNSQRCVIENCRIVGGRYCIALECCINTIVKKNSLEEFVNAGVGLLMSNDTTRVWYGPTPTSSYWNDSPHILDNGFVNTVDGSLCHILDSGSSSEFVRLIENNYFYNGANTDTQYGYLGRNCNPTMTSNWFENINYPVRILSSNTGEGGGATNIAGVTGAQPNGTWAINTIPDGYSYFGKFNGNYSIHAVNMFDVSGITAGSCDITNNFYHSLTGHFIKSTQSGSQRIVDGGNSGSFSGGGAYKNLTYGLYKHLFLGDTTGSVDAPTGDIGEYVESDIVIGSAVSLTTNTAANLTSLSLTAGDWEIFGNAVFSCTGVTISACTTGANTASATFPGSKNLYQLWPYTSGSNEITVPFVTRRMKLTSTTTVYGVVKANFSAGSVAAYGILCARRIR